MAWTFFNFLNISQNSTYSLFLGSTTITSALGPSTAKAKAMPSVTLTPTGGSGNRSVKKRPAVGKGATPLRPIEAQSVVNIAGMKYLVVPHPDPGIYSALKSTAGQKI